MRDIAPTRHGDKRDAARYDPSRGQRYVRGLLGMGSLGAQVLALVDLLQ